MEEKTQQAVEQIQKIEEQQEEKATISDLSNTLEECWLKVEPIFAEIGLV